MSEILGTNVDGTASIEATFANLRNAAVAKATDLAAVSPVLPATPVANSPAAAAASPSGTPVVAPPVNTPPVFGQPAQPQAVAPVPDPAAPAADPALSPAEQEIMDLPDTGMFRVTIGNQEMVVSGAEAKKRMMLHADYTRKTQSLAERERLLGEALGLDPRKIDANTAKQLRNILSEHQQMSQILSNPELYQRYGSEVFQASRPQTPQPSAPVTPQAGIDPNAIVSYGDVQGLVNQQMQALDAKLAELHAKSEQITGTVAERVQAEIQRLEDLRESTRMRGQVEAHINSVVQKHPVLNAIPDLVEVVKFNAYKMNPTTEKELYHSTQTVLAGILENIERHQSAAHKQELAKRAQVLQQGIEPPGGTAPSLVPNKLDPKARDYWDKLAQVARTYGRS